MYPNSKEEEKAILKARIQMHERFREPNGGRRSNDGLPCACMRMHAFAQLECMLCLVDSVELGRSNV